jgi:GTP-binding protein
VPGSRKDRRSAAARSAATPENPEKPPNPTVQRRLIYQEPDVRSILAVEDLRRAEFRVSVAQSAQLPPDRGAEVAFAGRSNAGKSSALNAITDHRGLAHVSKAPGRTRLLNFFALDDTHFLVDLPGYGYAAVAAETRASWEALLGGYLRARRALKGVVLVMDCRHPLTEHDLALLEFCAAAGRPVHVLLSKADKLARGERLKVLNQVRKELAALSPAFSVQLFSVQSGEGVEAARAAIAAWLGLAKTADKKNPGNKGRDSGALK